MSKQWQYLTVEVKPNLMGGLKAEVVQAVLDKHGRLGWELVNLVPVAAGWPVLLVFKKEN
ncbi:MAG: DUF4177 domain-containing protein [Stenotrophomonas sp.]